MSFLYPENISRFDESANEYVYLFPIVEVNPFAEQTWALSDEMPGVIIQCDYVRIMDLHNCRAGERQMES